MKLDDINIFKGLAKDELERLESVTEIRGFSKGETLFLEGEPSENLWLVLDGEIKVFKEYASGKSAILGIFSRGDIVAEVSVIDGKPYPASCQAVTDVRMGAIKRKDALRAITSNPTVALRLMSSLSRKLRDITDDLGSMAVQSVIRRLSRLLLQLAEKMGKKEGNTIRVDLFLTRKDIAECIGTSFEVAVRCLGKLQNEEILEISGKKLTILSPERLAKMAEEAQ